MEKMSDGNFCLLPQVKDLRISVTAGVFCLTAMKHIRVPPCRSYSIDYIRIAAYLQEKILLINRSVISIDGGDNSNVDNSGTTINILIDINVNLKAGRDSDCGNIGNERYRIVISPHEVKLIGASPQGLFRAATTFIQLITNHPREIPCLEIYDSPDFVVRGFYHDVTRGRVPTLDTLKHLVDTLAFYKVNQLQLYVEHAFAFSKIPELWNGKTPLTAEDILELDKYCIDRYIDLVPSLSTFGHLYELLRLTRFEYLNELEINASSVERCLWDRMAHYTLDVSNPKSFEVVKGMIEEYLPLFSSPYFNICCDETFDLGKGKNLKRTESEGVGKLYVEFVNKIMNVVISMGKKPMLWGDIILKYPELLSELPPDAIFLNWDYTPDVSDVSVKTFRDAGVTQYVCPGVQGWSRFAADINRACENISRMVRYGNTYGAVGVLNTDWGDCGQVNLLAHSYHGLAYGADLSWNVKNGNDNFDRKFEFLQWGLSGNRLGKLLRELGELSDYHFGNLYAWVNDKQCLWYKENELKSINPSVLAHKIARAQKIKNELEKFADIVANPSFKEYIFSAIATEWLLSLLIVKKKYEYGNDTDTVHTPEKIINDGRIILEQFKTLWRIRNRESELCDIEDTFESVFRKVASYHPPSV